MSRVVSHAPGCTIVLVGTIKENPECAGNVLKKGDYHQKGMPVTVNCFMVSR